MSFDLVTEPDDVEVDEDVCYITRSPVYATLTPFQIQSALHRIKVVHTQKLLSYKRLLEHGQHASAAQLHALQAELRMLRIALEDERAKAREGELERDRLQMKAYTQTSSVAQEKDVDLAAALRGDGKGNFNETEVRKAVRALKLQDRMRL